jgi:CBS domain-containing protein
MFSVKDIMVTPVVTIRKNTPLPDVIQKLMKGSFSGMPVVNTKKKVIGIVTELDILRAVEQGNDLTTLKASDIMSPIPITIDIDTPVYEVIKILLKTAVCSASSHGETS